MFLFFSKNRADISCIFPLFLTIYSNVLCFLGKIQNVHLQKFSSILLSIIFSLCVLRFYSPMGSCRAVSLPNHTLLGRLSPLKRLTSIVHILLPETDNCPSWISRRVRMIIENVSWSNLHERSCRPGRGQPCNLLKTSKMHIQLSHQGQDHWGQHHFQ